MSAPAFPPLYRVGQKAEIHKMDPVQYDGDPRGILWMWEPPRTNAQYVLGGDPTVGRTGWNRYARVKEDAKTDNGALEVVRIGRGKAAACGCIGCKAIVALAPDAAMPDHQVAEYAAPVDPFELGHLANALGRLYAGNEDDQCGCILEVHPGPGTSTYRQMIELGYTNHFRWERYADTVPTPTRQLGWVATPATNRDLWVKASRHISLRNAIVRSPWLAEEYADCRMTLDKGYAENAGGHDDRVRAFNLALWMARRWSMDAERTEEPVVKTGEIDFAHSDMSIDEIQERWASMLDV